MSQRKNPEETLKLIWSVNCLMATFAFKYTCLQEVVNSFKSLDLWISNDYHRDVTKQKNPLAPVGAKGRDAKGLARARVSSGTLKI